MTDHKWANVLMSGIKEEDVAPIIEAVNALTHAQLATRGAVIAACVQILAQTIAMAGPDIAKEMREGIVGLIDDYAMRLAVEAP